MKAILLLLIGLSFSAVAGSITMTDPDESTTDNGKTLCVYENAMYTFTFVTRAQSCPYAKTFDTEDSE